MLNTITHILTEIDKIDRITPICIYVGVGSAAHMVRNNYLEDTHYHQYPKILEELHRNIDMVSFHILIDPTLENPPFMTIDKSKGLIFEHTSPDTNMHVSLCGKHYVYSIKEAICTLSSRDDETDITEELHILNKIAIEMNILYIYNDFTGKSIKPLAKYFDTYINSHLDHIIYGLGNRGDYGCYIDLTANTSKFAYRLDRSERRSMIQVFNIFHLAYNKLDIDEETIKYPVEHLDMISISIISILKQTYEYFNDVIFKDLRLVYQLMTGKLKLDEINPMILSYVFSTEYYSEIKSIFNTGNYKLCFSKLLELHSSELDIIIYIKKLDIDKNILINQIVTNENEYRWGDELKYILEI